VIRTDADNPHTAARTQLELLFAPMSAEQFRRVMIALTIPSGGIARLVGVNTRTARRWASGASEVPNPVARLLRILMSEYHAVGHDAAVDVFCAAAEQEMVGTIE